MENDDTQDRRSTILDAAFKVFLTYGFKRTTMADIADAAGISRPALYLEFRNKADIYRAGFLRMLERTQGEVERALTSDAPIVDRVAAALEAAIIVPKRRIAQAPHGHELFEVKEELARDLGNDWSTLLGTSLARAFAEAAKNGEIAYPEGISGEDVAVIIVLCVDGAKHKKECDWETMAVTLKKLAELVVRPLMRKA